MSVKIKKTIWNILSRARFEKIMLLLNIAETVLSFAISDFPPFRAIPGEGVATVSGIVTVYAGVVIGIICLWLVVLDIKYARSIPKKIRATSKDHKSKVFRLWVIVCCIQFLAYVFLVWPTQYKYGYLRQESRILTRTNRLTGEKKIQGQAGWLN